jgi:cell division inhibitor SepF
MSVLNKVLDFVGWEVEEEEVEQEQPMTRSDSSHLNVQPNLQGSKAKGPSSKVVNIHTQQPFKVVIMKPENFEDAREVCEHLKNKKPVVVNLLELEKEFAQRILDFLSGGVCALEGVVQKVSQGIFVIAPNNVDVMGEFKDELRNKSALFPWVR